ncbi:MAG: four helix bundle protein [Chloroflexi bacterium]|nr:four helix bundle protein [Chloroflexota bacterium]
MGHNFRELRVWKRAIEFIVQIYKLSRAFPKDETYGLTSQLRRAATSISLNIAEGSGASSDVEFVRFLEMARRSVYEVITALEIAHRLDYCTNEGTHPLSGEADEIAAMISGLIKRLNQHAD